MPRANWASPSYLLMQKHFRTQVAAL